MLYLLLAILLNAYIIVVFKVFERYGVDNLQAIVANYWVCAATGSIFIGHFPIGVQSLAYPWLGWALLMGAGFISIFNLIAYSTIRDGITITTIANKLSLVIPVAFAVWLYAEGMNLMKAAGILLALPAVYWSSRSEGASTPVRSLGLALLLFVGSGLLDTLVNYVAMQFFSSGAAEADRLAQSIYLVHAFATAGCLGVVLVAVLIIMRRRRFAWKNVFAGLVLGVPNFFSIYYLLRLLQTKALPGSVAIPVNNIGIVLVASLTAILFFREHLQWQRVLGMLLSLLAILLILLSNLHG